MFGAIVTVVTINKPLNIENRIVRLQNVTEDGLTRDLLRKCVKSVPFRVQMCVDYAGAHVEL